VDKLARQPHAHAVSSSDPLEPKVYPAETPLAVAPATAPVTIRPRRTAVVGAPIRWSTAWLVAVITLVVAAVFQSIELLFGNATVNGGMYLIALVWGAHMHISRPRHRWIALAVAFVSFVVLMTITSAPLPDTASAYLRDVAAAVIVPIYAAVTHLPRRGSASPRMPAYVPMQPGQARRAAGTITLTDALRVFLSGPVRQPAHDLLDLQHGATLWLAARARRGQRFQAGRLVLQLDAGDPMSWQPRRFRHGYGEAITLPRPYGNVKIEPVRGPGTWNLQSHLLELLTLQAGAEHWEFAVPSIDVELIGSVITRMQ